MFLRNFVLTTSSVIFLGACSMKVEEGTIYYNYDFTWEETQQHMSERRLQNKATTESGEDLGLGIVMVAKDSGTKSNHYRLGECTGFFIDETTMLTNSHCVPKRVRDGEVPCRNRIVFAHGASNNNYNCRSVLFTHSGYNQSDSSKVEFNGNYVPDVTILEMEPVRGVVYFKKSPEPLKDRDANEELFMSSVDPVNSSSNLYEGRYSLRKLFKNVDLECAGYAFRYFLAGSGVFFKHGNSGSPIHDSNYNAKAIGFAGNDQDTDATVVDLSCLDNSSGKWEWKSSCINSGRIRK